MRYMSLTLFVLTVLLFVQPVSASEIEYTDYEITLKQAVDIQLNAEATPITDIYRDLPAYIHIRDVQFTSPKVSVLRANVRIDPSIISTIAYQFPKDVPLHIVGIKRDVDDLPVQLKSEKDSDFWYEIAYKSSTYFIQEDDVQLNEVQTKKQTAVRQGPTNKYHAFGTLEKGEPITITALGTKWFQIEYQSWRTPKSVDVREQLKPTPNVEKENMFQHIRLDATIDVPAAELDKVLVDKGILEGLGEAFLTGGEKHGINEAYLIAHALLESGHGTSELAIGVEVGLDKNGEAVLVTENNRETVKEIKTTYNMFGIGAADSCPLECGAKTAYENGWFTPEAAVEDGAAWIGEGYIYNEFHQNTLYKMKWNPKMGEGQHWKQYATDIGWAEKQTAKIKEIYEQLIDPKYMYDIPTYAKK